jgi:hypothetical protein
MIALLNRFEIINNQEDNHMKVFKNPFWSATALMIAALTVTVSAVMPVSAHAAPQSKADDQKKIKIRREEENRAKKEDRSYKRQVISLAKHYETTAKLVQKQGGDPKPLFDAAAYFTSQSK